jgi:hypothetical protein
MRLIPLVIAGVFALSACGGPTELSLMKTTEAGLAALADAGFPCPEPDISEVGAAEGSATEYTIIDCEDFALDLFADMPAWEAEFASECANLALPEQREVLGEIDLVFGADWLVRSRKYGDTVQWLPGAGPRDFASKLGGRVETWAQTCERLKAWD